MNPLWRIGFLVLFGAAVACFVGVQPSVAEPAGGTHATTFYCAVPFDSITFAYDFAVISKRSIWYTAPDGVFHFDGSSSRRVLPFTAFAERQLEVLNIEALSDSDVWVLGHNVRNWNKTMYHFDGVRWSAVPFPQVTADTTEDLVVWRFAMIRTAEGTRGFAVGQEGIVYGFDGKRWSILPRFTMQYLRALTVNGPNDVWAGGKGNTIFHYDGERWTQSPAEDPKSGNSVLDFSIVSPTDVWACGTRQLLHFDGNMWRVVPVPVSSMLRNIRMLSPNDGWMVSHDGEILHYDGAAWRLVDSVTNRVRSTVDGMEYVRTPDDSALYILGTNGVNRSHAGKLPTFTNVTFFTNLHTEAVGFAAADFDRNGTLDLLAFGELAQMPDRLYSNRGDGTFSEMTDRLHQTKERFGTGGVIGDFDNNGYPDILLLRFPEQDLLYRNQGDWRFYSEPSPLKPADGSYRQMVSCADMDNDGSLDLVYLTNAFTDTLTQLRIYYNDGVGRFTRSRTIPVPVASGGIVTSILLADLNNDGRPDIYVAEADSKTRVYLSEGTEYRDATAESGLDGSMFGPTAYINGAIPADVNSDGALDLLVAVRHGPSVVFMNNGHGVFAPGQKFEYPVHLDPQFWFGDIDADGLPDLFYEDRFYHNEQGTFVDYSHETGLRRRGGPAMLDIDHDGDPDLLLYSEARMFVYRNGYNPANVVSVTLEGIRSNAEGIGAVVELKNSDGRTLDVRQVLSPQPEQFAPPVSGGNTIVVRFPSGRAVEYPAPRSGPVTISEFTGPAALWWDLYYSVRRSMLYADGRVEAVKASALAALILAGLFASRKKKFDRELFTPWLFAGLVLLYLLLIHLTVRHGLVVSGAVSLGVTVAFCVVAFIVVGRLHEKRSATIISHYRLQEQLGEGGMGKVYKAVDLNTKAVAAIKVLNPHLLSDPENNKRLRSEGQLLSSFNHPNILRVFEIGEAEGRTFIAMEFLTGGTLKDHLRTSFPLTTERFREIAAGICAALEEIHAKGIIHRDIKSINLMFDGSGRIKLMDFGLSKSPLVTMMTTLGTIIGTLGYVAPEQITNLQVDHRADLFSFGVVLYEMLTNTLPFKGENEMAVIHSLFNTVPLPPSAINPAVSPALDAMVMRCLERDPANRPSSMGEVLEALS